MHSLQRFNLGMNNTMVYEHVRTGSQFEIWVEDDEAKEKNHDQVGNLEDDIPLQSVIRQQNQKEYVHASESFIRWLFETTIEVSCVPCAFLPQCLDQPSFFNGDKIRMNPLLGTSKQKKLACSKTNTCL